MAEDVLRKIQTRGLRPKIEAAKGGNNPIENSGLKKSGFYGIVSSLAVRG